MSDIQINTSAFVKYIGRSVKNLSQLKFSKSIQNNLFNHDVKNILQNQNEEQQLINPSC